MCEGCDRRNVGIEDVVLRAANVRRRSVLIWNPRNTSGVEKDFCRFDYSVFEMLEDTEDQDTKTLSQWFQPHFGSVCHW
jgi:hypothetical protein